MHNLLIGTVRPPESASSRHAHSQNAPTGCAQRLKDDPENSMIPFSELGVVLPHLPGEIFRAILVIFSHF